MAYICVQDTAGGVLGRGYHAELELEAEAIQRA